MDDNVGYLILVGPKFGHYTSLIEMQVNFFDLSYITFDI